MLQVIRGVSDVRFHRGDDGFRKQSFFHKGQRGQEPIWTLAKSPRLCASLNPKVLWLRATWYAGLQAIVRVFVVETGEGQLPHV